MLQRLMRKLKTSKEDEVAVKVITLPNREEIIRRLRKVENNKHIEERLYSLIAEYENRTLVPAGLPHIIGLCVFSAGFVYEDVELNFLKNTPKYIDALVDDAEFAEAAKAVYEDRVKRYGK